MLAARAAADVLLAAGAASARWRLPSRGGIRPRADDLSRSGRDVCRPWPDDSGSQ